MRTRIFGILTIMFVSGACLGAEKEAAVDPKAAEPSKPELPKITHENLFQMEELVEQGADPNAPYWLFAGHP